jgi:iron complex outermembrane receptor protein
MSISTGFRRSHALAARAAAALVPLAGLFASQAALAAEENTGLEEVVVTAQFREEKLQETPIAITAVTEEMMQARGQEAIFEVTQQAPNVQIKKQSGPYGSSTSAFIRGVGQGDFNFALEPGVGMYIDDVYFPTLTGSAFEIVDLQRVEILRGPQGVLGGRNSIGGLVRLITKAPTGEGGGYAEVTTGSFNRIGGKAAADMKLGENLFLRITGATNSKKGYVTRLDFACAQPALAAAHGIVSSSSYSKKGCKLGTLGGEAYTAGRAALRWVPTDKLEVNITGDMTRENSEPAAMVLINAQSIPAMGPSWGPWFNVAKNGYYTYETFTDTTSGFNPVVGFNRTPYSTPAINDFTGWGLAMTIDYKIADNLSIKSITSRRNLANDFATATDGSPLDGETGFNELQGHSFQQELRLNGTAGPVDYTLGAFYFTQKNRNRNRIDIGYVIFQGAFDFISDELATTKSQAAYGHAVWHVTDKFDVTAGLRYSKEKKEQLLGRLNPGDGGQTGSLLPFFASLLPSGYADKVPFNGNRLDYSINLDYKVTDSFMLYGSHSSGFKNGGVSPRFFYASHIIPFGMEKLKAYELGFKSELFERTLRINGAIFLNKYLDQQVGAPGSVCPWLAPGPIAPCLAITNLQDSENKGAELEVSWQPTRNTLIDASGSWIDSKYTRISPLVTANPNFIQDPKGVPGLPQYKWSIGAQQSFDLPNGSRLTPRVDYNYEAERTPAVTNAASVPAYGLLNARLAWDAADKDWEVAVGVTNLTDKYYFNNIFDLSTFGGWTTGQVGVPREWSLTVRKTF